MLAAKAIVLGGVTFVLSLVAVVVSFLVAVPILQDNGMAPPAFPTPSLTDAAVLRALVLTALFMTGVTLVALAVGMLVRRSAAAITLTIVLVVLPLVAGTVLPGHVAALADVHDPRRRPGDAARQAARPTPSPSRGRSSGPGSGIAVVLGYAAVGLGAGVVAAAAAGRMTGALRAEWTKARTVPSTGWLLLRRRARRWSGWGSRSPGRCGSTSAATTRARSTP